MNDPNAPIYFNGHYHMFYQYNPNAAIWGDMHWGHAISANMVHWRHLPVALAPTPGGPDADGCFTGTAAVQDGRVVVLYTGVRAAPEDEATIKDGGHSLRETQCLATSNDSELETWSKLPTPVIQAPPPGMQVNGFRDPSPWRQGDWWYMVLGSGIANQGGAVLLYKSKDLRNWEYVHVLTGRNQNGATSFDPFDPWEVWECPEFFALGGKHVLICSTGGKAWWRSGVLDAQTMCFRPEKAGILDHGSFYAPKTQLDKSGNRILWGWIPETRPQDEFKAAGWAGLMSLPRVLSLDGDGRLRIGVAEAMNQLRGREQTLDIAAEEESNQRQMKAMRLEGCCGEILCRVRRTPEPFELALQSADGATTWLRLQYDPLHPGQVTIDARPLPVLLEEKEDLELHLYVDGSVIEAFVNHEGAWTRRFYPPGSSPQDMRLQWTGKTAGIVSLSVWQISPISAHRLTT
jgi:beta-fructofuranosidase